MKKNILASVACATILWATAAGCSEETVIASGDDAGYIALDLNFDPNPLTGARGDRSRAAAVEITQNDLTLTLTHASGAIPPKTFTVGEFGSQQLVNTGQYTLEANYGSADSEGWDAPYYYGSQQLTVKNEASTPVKLPVQLANAIVNVTLSDGFTSYMTDYTVTVTTSSGTDYVWAADESRRLYVKPGSVMVSVEFTKPNGKSATAQVDPFTAEARHQYNVTVDVEAGTAEMLKLTFDDTITDVKDVDIDISDANLPMLAAAPEILTEGFEAGLGITNVAGCAYDGSLKATIVARGKIDSAVLNVTSAYLKSKGWPESIDLANPGASQQLLESYGIKTLGLTGNKAVFAVVDFSNLISKLLYVEGADNTSSFSITVTDTQGKDKTVDLFSVSVEKLIVEVLDGSEITTDGHATVKIHYNGGEAQDNIKLYAYNDRGTVDQLPFTATPGSQANTYDLAVTSSLITLDQSLTIYAIAGEERSDNYLLKVPSLRIIDAETNAFAKHAYVTVRLTNQEAIAAKGDVKFEVSTDGGNSFTEVASTVDSSRSRALEGGTVIYNLTGLTHKTNYTFRAKLADEITGTSTLTTEEAAQLTNNEMEDWDSEKVYSKKTGWVGIDIYRWFPNSKGSSYWATRNAATTSQNAGTTCYYTSFSGTIQTNGTNGFAAEISTIGWGKGVTYGGANDKPTYTAGMLFMGEYSYSGANSWDISKETITYGQPFTSRPKSFSFNYKFASYNGESFKAYAVIENRDGGTVTELARGEFESAEDVSGFTPMTVNLNYTNRLLKATHAYVVFISSTATNPSGRGVKGSITTFYGYADSKYIGNVLTVDDIMLNY